MDRILDITVQLIRALQRIYARRWHFLYTFLIVLVMSLAILSRLDLLPNGKGANMTGTLSPVAVRAEAPKEAEIPLRVEIAKIGLSVNISNPTTTDIAALDTELLKGAVRYPTSAKLNENGNVILFGHSSYLPIVRNNAYKAFNDIQKLVAGDRITVYSAGTAYVYRVRTVSKESTLNAVIPLDVNGRVLTLSTCDSFGAKTDRFVVVANLVESYPEST